MWLHTPLKGIQSKALVYGGGIGGLSTSLALSCLGFHVTIREKISETAYRSALDLESSNLNHQIGLWHPSLRGLAAMEGGIFDSLKPYLSFVGPSSYRTAQGLELASPSFTLDNLDPHLLSTSIVNNNQDYNQNISSSPPPALAFVKESDLLRCLVVGAERKGVSFEFESEFAKMESLNSVPFSSASSSTASSFDLLVAADGCFSQLRSFFHPNNKNEDELLKSRGYVVFRGESCKRLSDNSFQSWGPGVRFACVPSLHGNAWFAAISHSKLLAIPSLDEKSNSNRSSSSSGSGELYKSALQQLFQSGPWQKSTIIHALLADTGTAASTPTSTGISRIEAVAFQRVLGAHEALSGVFPLSPPSTTTTPSEQAVAFVGDAAHTLDPILAQGAGRAVEDALHLAACIYQHITSSTRTSTTTTATCGPPSSDEWKNILGTFESIRRPRLQRLHAISNFSQAFGQIHSPWQCSMRDLLMRATPSVIKTSVMDAAIRASLSSDRPFPGAGGAGAGVSGVGWGGVGSYTDPLRLP